MDVARHLVQGCDVWLNTPRRGMEASGTSGMKAALNGVLNCSILDGWWDEAAAPNLGWSIGRGESYANYDHQDDLESQALYELIEQQIVPMFYDRDSLGVPRQWVARMKECIATLAPQFNTNRMVQDYTEKLYLPALRRSRSLKEDNLKHSIELAHQKEKLHKAWDRIRIEEVKSASGQQVGVHKSMVVTAVVQLDHITPEEVQVQAMSGPMNHEGQMINQMLTTFAHVEDLGNGRHRYEGELTPSQSGKYGFALRVVPGGRMFEGIYEPGLVRWDSAAPGIAGAEGPGHA
jgi:starch phosphorylase